MTSLISVQFFYWPFMDFPAFSRAFPVFFSKDFLGAPSEPVCPDLEACPELDELKRYGEHLNLGHIYRVRGGTVGEFGGCFGWITVGLGLPFKGFSFADVWPLNWRFYTWEIFPF